MLRRGTDTDRARSTDAGGAGDDLRVVLPPPAPTGLGAWAAPVSYLALDREVVAELVRAALASPTVATIRSGEVAVGAMLASLAVRGEDALLDQLLPLAGVELRIHRYSTGQLTPLAVHPAASVGELLRALARCAAQPQGETWEAVAHDGTSDPVAVAAARSAELRWLQPPAPGSPHAAPWADLTTADPAPGSAVGEWGARLSAAPAPPMSPSPAPRLPGDPVPAFGPPGRPAVGGEAAGPGAGGLGGVTLEQVDGLVRQAVHDALASAPIELDLDAATLDELRDTTVLERLVDAIRDLDQQVRQIEGVGRQVTALTAAIDDLADSTRSLLRHQWDNMPPQGFWLRVQKADDELRRSIDELAAEVRARRRPTS